MLKTKHIIFYVIFAIFFFNPEISFSERTFSWKCSKDTCDLYAILSNKEKKLISSDWGRDLVGKIVFKNYANNIGSLRFGCGNNCSYTIFIDLNNGDSSENYYNVLAVNPKKKMVVIPDTEGSNAHTILIMPIFGVSLKPTSITRNDMYQTSDISVKANFLPDGKLKINYKINENSDDKTEIVSINYKKPVF